MAEQAQELVVADVETWRAWLAEHVYEQAGVWLLLAKKGTTSPTSLSYAQALEEALCQGWIDGQANRVDERTYRQRYTPRRARSLWSTRNVGLVATLTEAGRMKPNGLAEVERAKADGRWDAAYAGPATIEVPDDLAAALAAEPAALEMFMALNAQNRYAILHRVTTALRPETRARRIAQNVAMLARGETAYAQKGAGSRARVGDGRGEPHLHGQYPAVRRQSVTSNMAAMGSMPWGEPGGAVTRSTGCPLSSVTSQLTNAQHTRSLETRSCSSASTCGPGW